MARSFWTGRQHAISCIVLGGITRDYLVSLVLERDYLGGCGQRLREFAVVHTAQISFVSFNHGAYFLGLTEVASAV
jgi:hypothetical protein